MSTQCPDLGRAALLGCLDVRAGGGTAVIEFVADERRTFSGHALQPDGTWRRLMRIHYRRVR